MEILNGNKVSRLIRYEIRQEVNKMLAEGKKAPHLAAILVGDNGASHTYVSAKAKDCTEVGFNSTVLHFEEKITQQQLIAEIQKININHDIDGLIVQLPLPKHIDTNTITQAIDWRKDVDGFHPMNVGLMFKGLDCFLPATPFGIIKLLEHYNISLEGKHAVVIGRSDIVGKPISSLLLQKNCTVTTCHSKTKNLEAYTIEADIIIAALGIPLFLKPQMVKQGAVVIDVGITRVEDKNSNTGYKLLGDADFDSIKDKCSFITPVPGGVGPMTRVALLLNTLRAAKINHF
ncbi:MAG: bifunctional 5,10-methylenetetrahydrofolate dehydrogenase/5,10-methenyltetrahydrofolate cyclohydrolase [Bacteroidia bacterium]